MSSERKGRNRGPIPEGGIPIPPYHIIELQERAKSYIEIVMQCYSALESRESDPGRRAELDAKWEHYSREYKTGAELDVDEAKRMVSEYPDLIWQLRAEIEESDS